MVELDDTRGLLNFSRDYPCLDNWISQEVYRVPYTIIIRASSADKVCILQLFFIYAEEHNILFLQIYILDKYLG